MRETSAKAVRTLADLARLAGVSTGTVSRALAGKAVVNPATAARIRALAAEHDFHPNQMASRLRTQRTGVIGIAIPLGHERRQHVSDPFFITMVGQLADLLTENGYDMMISRVIPDAPDWLERIVDSGMIDGVLLIGQSDQIAAIDRVAEWYRPMVVWGSRIDGQVHCSVGTDNVTGGRLMGERLIARGARRIAFLGEAGAPELADRYEGVCQAMRAAGIGDAPMLLEAPLAFDIMEPAVAAQLAAHGDAIDGIAAASDLLAMMAIRVLADRDIAVPDRVAVIGFDNLPLTTHTVPRITTIHQDIALGARHMVDALFARMRGETTASIVMPATLVARDSA